MTKGQKSKKLWKPSCQRVQNSHMTRFTCFVKERKGLEFNSWSELHSWSVKEKGHFWSILSEYVDLKWAKEPRRIYTPPHKGKMQGARWFEGGHLNFAENVLKSVPLDEEVLVSYEESRKVASHTGRSLWNRVAILSANLKSMGLKSGDRVACILSNSVESVEILLAITALGATWSSCSPDFGTGAISERLHSVRPKIIFCSGAYRYKGKLFDTTADLEKIFGSLASLESVIEINGKTEDSKSELKGKVSYESFFKNTGLKKDNNTGLFPINFKSLAFSDPLYIMFSSGTTGAPKCIVHGVGGTLLQHKKELMLHCDLKRGDSFCFYTNTSWMMWNWMVSALSLGVKLVLYSGAPSFPDPLQLWELAQNEKLSLLGTSPAYLSHSKNHWSENGSALDLSNLRTLVSTGSPLLPEHYEWVYSHLKKDIHLASISGGTDILSCFVLGNPNEPVYEGEIQVAGLGMSVEAWSDPSSHPDEKAELICTEPFVSMPLYFLNDPDGCKLTASYFSSYSEKEVWKHGDYIEVTATGGYVIHGRSDATLNPNGVRMGTSEFYNALEGMKGVKDSLVVAQKKPSGDKILLFLVLSSSESLTEEMKSRVRAHLEKYLTKRHRPHKIFEVDDLPYTHSGKKLEILVSRMINGGPISNHNAVKNPACLAEFVKCKKLLEESG